MPCPFTGPQMFWAGPSFIKNVFTLWESQTFCARQKDDLRSVKLVFVPVLVQNILGPVKGQGISFMHLCFHEKFP